MKLIIAGGRTFKFTRECVRVLDDLLTSLPVTEVVSGRQRGADKEGEDWAKSRGLPIKPFPPDWNLGLKGGPIRNRQMAEYADALALFKGNNGTLSMFHEAKRAGIKIYDLRGL